jgi:predicted ATPase
VTLGESDGMPIRTPDQRLRVFVSATMGELAGEREATSRAISALRLTPVVFGDGARPHPPRDLYRAYIAQSDIFIGLYWQRYGWVGPGMTISGLEDEFELARDLPRLLYVKAPAPDREAGLAAMLDRVREEGTPSYRSFRTTRELGRLVRDDLAVLLSERFAATRPEPAERPEPQPTQSGQRSAGPRPARRAQSVPASLTSLIGRGEAVDDVVGLLERPDVRLVTLTGPGGIGKTRLAMAVGDALSASADLRIAFVELAGDTEPGAALGTIARAVGVDLTMTTSPLDAIVGHLGDDAWLLIVDNMEQVLDAAVDLDTLLTRCAGTTILATSMTALRLRAEHEYPVPPLPDPPDPSTVSVEELGSSPAVALFVERARSVSADFALTEGNARAVADICRRLDGLPLAIELAAARIRLLEPAALLARLATSLDALGTAAVDVPERQRTLRATVEWSGSLLDDAERSLLETVAVFEGGWTIEAAAAVAALDEDRALDLIEDLARHSLVQLDATELGPRSRMLGTIRAFAAECLAARTDVDDIRRRHAEHFRSLVEQADRPLRGRDQSEWADRLEADAGNLVAAGRWYLDHDIGALPHLIRVLWPFAALRDHTDEMRAWIAQLDANDASFDTQAQVELLWAAAATAVESGDDTAALAARARLEPLLDSIGDPFLRALAELVMAWTSSVMGDVDLAVRQAEASLAMLHDQRELFWTAVADSTLGFLNLAAGRYDAARRHLTEMRQLGEQVENPWLSAGSRLQLGLVDLARGQLGSAEVLLDEGLHLAMEAGSANSVAVSLDAFAQLASQQGDWERAALLAGAADGCRRISGIRLWPALRPNTTDVQARIREALGPGRFDEVFIAGAALSRKQAAAAALERRRSDPQAS